MSKRVVVFNHKGGVSKTTSVFNLGWTLAKESNVLIVDADPQCNLTSLVLRDDFEKYYVDDKTKRHNIKDGVSVAFKGSPTLIDSISCTSPKRNNRLFLLAGHPTLSEFEASLTFAQTSNNAIATLQNLPGAFSELLRKTEEEYNISYTLIDLNPSLSSINQNLFLSSDAFIVPTNPDPFSVMAIKTLCEIFPRWTKWKADSMHFFAESAYPMADGIPKFVGVVAQRFNIRNGKAAKPFRDNIEEIKAVVKNDFVESMIRNGMAFKDTAYCEDFVNSGYCLSEIPDFQSLLPRAYDAGVPVFELKNDEFKASGNVRDQMVEKRDMFKRLFQSLAQNVRRIVNNEPCT